MADVPGGAATAEPAAAFPQIEFDLAIASLQKPSRLGQGLVLVISLALFVLVQNHSSTSAQALVVLIGVLLFHELGHYAGMRLFGYRDVRMFFIPFFGAAVAGKPAGAASWKEGIVTLLGPLPGILVAFVLALEGPALSPIARDVVLSLISINAFNLLPLAGLDGARLLQQVLFSRRRWLEISFQACAAVLMVVVAIALETWVLGIFAYLMVIVLPFRWRLLGAAAQLRDDGPALPPVARELTGDAARTVFMKARALHKDRIPKNLAPTMEQLVDATNLRSPSLIASVALFATWTLSLLLALVALVLLYTPPDPAPAQANDLFGFPGLWPGEEFRLTAPKLIESDVPAK
ncbi:MAG TPA: hypothetical protein VGG33_06670 [Polyangia bacterium]